MLAQKSTRYPSTKRPAIGASPATALRIAISAALGLFGTLTTGGTAHAGDILRGGFNAAPVGGKSNGGLTASGISPSAQNAKDILARSNDALQAMQAMQAAAQQAAQARKSIVPNGLVTGGLQLAKPAAGAPPAVQGANQPVQAASQGQTNVNIVQTKPDAILDWTTFNVGKNTSVNFNQAAGGADMTKWIVFNEINDPSGVPSQILGSIHAQGQVYLINQNGIIFGGSSQINVHSLAASSLPIDSNLVANGLLNNNDGEFLFSAFATGSFTPMLAGTLVSDPSFTPTTAPIALGKTLLTGTTPTVTVGSTTLANGVDYTVGKSSGGKTVIDLTLSGLAKANGQSLTVSYEHAANAAVTLTEPTYTLAQPLAAKTSPTVTVGTTTLKAGVDYKLKSVGGNAVLSFTPSGLIKIDGAAITVSYEDAAKQMVTDPAATIAGPTYKFALPLASGTTPALTVGSGSSAKTLVAGVDYTLNAATGTVTFLTAGLEAIAGKSVKGSYIGEVANSANVAVAPDQLGGFLAATPNVTVTFGVGAAKTTLPTTDYTYQETNGKTVLTLTTAGLQELAAAGSAPQVTVSYDEAKIGNVVVEAGANITSPASSANVGGRVTLVGPNVINDGTISTVDGQTILAAGYQVGFTAHTSDDPTLRGLDTYVGLVPFGGFAANGGLMQANEADVTIAGKSVNQFGVIDSGTSVTLNGRVDLLASYDAHFNANYSSAITGSELFLPGATGAVTLGPGSVTQILPELSSASTIIGTQLALPSVVNIQGLTIHLEENAILAAPNAQSVSAPGTGSGNTALDSEGNNLAAGMSLSTGQWFSPSGANNAQLVSAAGQIYLDAGSAIDVAGSANIPVPVAQNIVAVQLLGSQLANSPLQRAGILHGQTIYVDLRQTGVYDGVQWVGTPLADASGFVNLIQRGVGQLTIAGGTVGLSAGGSVVVQPGATINVAGGSVAYQGGLVESTRLISNGQLVDISQATPGLVYEGIYTGTFTQAFTKYNLDFTFTSSLLLNGAHYEASYLQGGNGGAITITAPSVALDGTLLGATVNGPHQRMTDSLSSAANLATPSSFSLILQGEQIAPGTNVYTAYSPTPPSILFEDGSTLEPANPFAVDGSGNPLPLRKDRQSEVILSPALLTTDGFGSLTINNSDGPITVPTNTSLSAPPTGAISLQGANIVIDGKVTAPGGSLSFTTYALSPYDPYFTLYKSSLNTVMYLSEFPNGPTAAATAGRGNFTLGPTAFLSTAGLIVDDRPTATAPESLPLVTAGGMVTIQSYNTNLKPGSTISVSGGVEIAPNSKQDYGAAGTIDVAGGLDPAGEGFLANGSLALGSTLLGYAGLGAKGGTLEILAPSVQIGAGTMNPNTLVLAPDFFSQGGFTSFSLTGLGARGTPTVLIAPGTVIEPTALNAMYLPNVSNPNDVTLTPILLPQAQRTPVSFSFSSGASLTSGNFENPAQTYLGSVVMGAGAMIKTDPGASISFSGDTVGIFGSIIAPAGSISVSALPSAASASLFTGPAALLEPSATVELGSNSFLSTAGATLLYPGVHGYTSGSVLAGGTITVAGNIVAETGATLDVSGTSGVVELSPAYSDLALPGSSVSSILGSFLGAKVTPTLEDSNGGSIVIKGSQEIFWNAKMVGAAGGPMALGGSLTISTGIFISTIGVEPAATSPELVISQDGPTFPTNYAAGNSLLGTQPIGANGKPIRSFNLTDSSFIGSGFIGANSFAGGGFDDVSLVGTVRFNGPVSISANAILSVAARGNQTDGGVIYANGPVSLSAPYVQIGLAFPTPGDLVSEATAPNGNYAPSEGPGSLNVSASLIDIGNLSLQGIGNASFNAVNGDIRGDGTLDVQGRVTLTAGQIYPPTESTFNVFAYNPTVTVASSTDGSNAVTLASAQLPAGFGKGSSLLGSTVEKISGKQVTLTGLANQTITTATPEAFALGSITVASSGNRNLPLSAGGMLNLYAAEIIQGGTLRAPIGTINLGWDGSGTAPVDPIVGAAGLLSPPTTTQLTLLSGSITSVSAVDPLTGQGLIIPYGLNYNGNAWIDPAGNDITAGGAPAKTISLSAKNVSDQAGATLDLTGGGDLFAYQFVTGAGGTIDITGSGATFNGGQYLPGQLTFYKGSYWSAIQATSTTPTASNPAWAQLPPEYAVIPGYQATFAPYAPFNAGAATLNPPGGGTPPGNAGPLGTDAGYVSNGLAVGERVYLGASAGLPSGYYTLLPARYALLPGAFLVTPLAATMPVGTQLFPLGSSIVSGYEFNSMSLSQTAAPMLMRFEVDPASVIAERETVNAFSGNSFLAQGAAASGVAAPRLPQDGGQLVIQVAQSLALQGVVDAQAGAGGQGGLVDITSPSDIDITAPGKSGPAGSLSIEASELSSFGAESLLIGGIRTFGADGTSVTVQTNNIVVENGAQSPLSAPDLILAANDSVTVKKGASIEAAGTLEGNAEALTIHDEGSLANGASLTFSQGGVPISFPNGTPAGATVTSSVAVTITQANGSTSTTPAGIPIQSGLLTAGSTVTLAAGGGSLTYNSPTGASVPIMVGDGALVRVSTAASAPIARVGVSYLQGIDLSVASGAKISGASVTLDSTDNASLSSSATVTGQSIRLDAGQISVELAGAGALTAGSYGLALNSANLNRLTAGATSFSLLSYTALDVYGNGEIGSAALSDLALHAAEIRGFQSAGQKVIFAASNISMDDSPNGIDLGPAAQADGSATFRANTIQLGSNPMAIDQFTSVSLIAPGGLSFSGRGSLTVQGNLSVATPLISGGSGANETITVNGNVEIASAGEAGALAVSGLGASLSVTAAGSLVENTLIQLPSGEVTLEAKGPNPVGGGSALSIGGTIKVKGTSQAIFDLQEYTPGGQVTLTADQGSVDITKSGVINVSANPGGGNAGSLTIQATGGEFTSEGSYLGHAGAGGTAGSFTLAAGSLLASNAAPGTTVTLGTLTNSIASGGFTQAVSIRDVNDAVVQVNEEVKANSFTLSADNGAIDVTAEIDAAGQHASATSAGTPGGAIQLIASGNVTIEKGALLDVSGGIDDAAGKGGAVTLEAGSETNGAPGNGFVTVNGTINLGVDSITGPNSTTTPAAAAQYGQFTGTLHIRSPQTTIGSTIIAANSVINASSIEVEGYKIYDATSTGTIDAGLQSTVMADAQAFAQSTTASMLATSLASGSNTKGVLVVVPGAEIIDTNPNAPLTLSTDWNLGTFDVTSGGVTGHFPGVLTIRAAGNLIFDGALSDGFAASGSDGTLRTAPLLAQNTALPANLQSWSYNLTAGADFSAVDVRQVQPALNDSGGLNGSLELGIRDSNPSASKGSTAKTSTQVAGYYQVIRTGTGDINIAAAGDVELMNPFATIYTAGAQVTYAQTVNASNGITLTLPNGTVFDVPINSAGDIIHSPTEFGAQPLLWKPQYSFAGGNVTIDAGEDITRVTGGVQSQSELELPINWLYHRGSVNSSGDFTTTTDRSQGASVASTTWWVDFSNFFEGVGALGGGNVILSAGRNVVNVDAVVPTNALMGYYANSTSLPKGVSNQYQAVAGNLIELGGGDLSVSAGGDINAGVYYVERGDGTLTAGGSILTNSTRYIGGSGLSAADPSAWLPTTLFLGQGSFEVSARGNIELGPVTNPFLLPGGVGNLVVLDSQGVFSTYAPEDAVAVSSIGGSVTMKEISPTGDSILFDYMVNQLLYPSATNGGASNGQPWLRLDASTLTSTTTTPQLAPNSYASGIEVNIMPATLEVSALGGDINLVGPLLLAPAPNGTLNLAAQGSINALQPAGLNNGITQWSSSSVDLSDADPAAIPGVASLASLNSLGNSLENLFAATAGATGGPFVPLNPSAGSAEGVLGSLEIKEALHDANLLHAGDLTPVHIYAETGSISGLRFFSGKAARIAAGSDITDIGLFIQNDQAGDVSVVAAGRDIIPYDPNSTLRQGDGSGDIDPRAGGMVRRYPDERSRHAGSAGRAQSQPRRGDQSEHSRQRPGAWHHHRGQRAQSVPSLWRGRRRRGGGDWAVDRSLGKRPPL